MLIIDRTQRTWAILSLAICSGAAAVYFAYSNAELNGPSGGSLPGLIFGIIAAGMMIFAGLLAARRRFPAARLGSAQFWLRGHLWIGTMTVPFALFHAGFGWGGRLELLLWALFFAVVASGFWGLGLQQLLPRMMLEQIPRETFVEQIPHLCLRFTAESDRLLADLCGPLEITLKPIDLQQFRPHLVPFFEEDRKKNRNDYPKSLPESEQLQIFLAKVYSAVQAPAARTESDSSAKPSPSPATPPAPPIVPAPITSTSQADESMPLESPPAAPVAAAKPDPKAVLAALKAKKEAAAAAAAGTPAVAEVASATPSPPPAATPVSGPTSTGESAPTSAPTPATESTAAPSKPDAKAMLAALKAKKDAAAAPASVPAAKQAPSATGNSPTAAKTVTESAESGQAAARVAPPTPAQLAELKLFYLELIRPQLPLCRPSRGWMESMRRAALACRIRGNSVHPQFIPVFERLHDVCEQRRQFAFVQRYHHWLHGWLMIHIPATVALYLILLVHAVVALRVVPFGNFLR